MSDEPKHKTSRAGMLIVLLAVGGSAIGVIAWHLRDDRNPGLDTSGFDMNTTPDSAHGDTLRPAGAAGPVDASAQQTSLGMVKGGKGMLGPPPKAGGKSPASPDGSSSPAKYDAALALKEAANKNEKLVDAFIRRMEAKHPSITQYGKDWAASPELRALRDQYWREKDPLKFAYGLAKSDDFGKLIKKYAADPGIRDVLVTGIKEAPPSLLGAVGGVFQNDQIVKDLATTVLNAVGLPPSMTGFLDDGDAKPQDPNKVVSEIMNSAAAKNQPSPVQLDDKDADKAPEAAPNNGFTPLRGR